MHEIKSFKHSINARLYNYNNEYTELHLILSEVKANEWYCFVVNIEEGDVMHNELDGIRNFISEKLKSNINNQNAEIIELIFTY